MSVILSAGEREGSPTSVVSAPGDPSPSSRVRMTLILLTLLFAQQAAAASPKRAVVLVPGMTGTKLCDAESGRVLWGDTTRLLMPWDGGYRIALPFSGNDDRVVPCGVIREMRVMQWRKDIYAGLIRFFERNAVPFTVAAYDWRRDNVTNARQLAATLDRLSAKHDAVSLICQSNAAHICRYAIRYGDVSLDQAEKGERRLPRTRVEQIILVGNANGGSIRILRELNRGRRYFRLIGRRFRPETFFTFPSLFQELPVYTTDLFVPVNVDLFDADSWENYQWSIYAPEVASRVERSERFGTATDRRAYLVRALDEAQRFHRLLRAATGGALPQYYSIQSRDQRTPSRARLERRGDRWVTSIDPDAPGDRHATLESQQWLSDEERTALAEPTIFVSGRHFEMITTDETREHLLRILQR